MQQLTEVSKLTEFAKALRKLYPIEEISEDLVKTIKSLEDFVFSLHEKELFELIEASSSQDIDFIQKAFCDYETLLEKSKALELINHKCSENHCLFEDRGLSRTFDYAIAEGEMAGITKNDKVLIIGSGPFPETAIGYAKTFGCNITCIEKEEEFVNISRTLIKKIGFAGNINIVEGLGQNVDTSKFTKILVTILSEPKEAILDNIKKSKAGIILRTSFGSSRIIYKPLDLLHLRGFNIVNKLIRLKKNFTSSILIYPCE